VSRKPLFHQKNGLTRIALLDFYVQRCGWWGIKSVDLFHEEKTFRVRIREVKVPDVVIGDFKHLTAARWAWDAAVKDVHGKSIAEAQSDSRFSVQQEASGQRDPVWVARNCGKWIGWSGTEQGAWLLCYQEKFQLEIPEHAKTTQS